MNGPGPLTPVRTMSLTPPEIPPNETLMDWTSMETAAETATSGSLGEGQFLFLHFPQPQVAESMLNSEARIH